MKKSLLLSLALAGFAFAAHAQTPALPGCCIRFESTPANPKPVAPTPTRKLPRP